MKTLFMLSILVIVMILAPLNRIQKPHYSDMSVSASDEAERIEASTNLISLGSVAAANQGPYFISGYQHPQCQGSIAILPLYRNAEGGQILKRLIQHESLRYGVLFKGEVHQEFPQFIFAIAKVKRGINQIRQGGELPPVRAVAFAELGECRLAEQLARITL